MQDTLGKCRPEYSDAIGITHQPATPLPKDKRMPFHNVDTKRPEHRTQYPKPKPETTEGAKRPVEEKSNPKNHSKSYSYKGYLEKQRNTASHDQISTSDKKLHPPAPSSTLSSGHKQDHQNQNHQGKKETLSPSPVKREQVTPVKNGPVNGCSSEEKGKISTNKIKVQPTNGLLKPKNANLPRLHIKKVFYINGVKPLQACDSLLYSFISLIVILITARYVQLCTPPLPSPRSDGMQGSLQTTVSIH